MTEVAQVRRISTARVLRHRVATAVHWLAQNSQCACAGTRAALRAGASNRFWLRPGSRLIGSNASVGFPGRPRRSGLQPGNA